jgi:HPt (histidine-containing phosphotransfer) domain-containing protein
MGIMPDPALADAMNRLWAKFLPQMEERVATVEAAARALAAATLTRDLQEKAGAEAHKLAGVLGTFGLHHGTELAREAEELFKGDLNSEGDASARSLAIVGQLRAVLASRQ